MHSLALPLAPGEVAKITRRGPLLMAELMRFLTPEEARQTAPALMKWSAPVVTIQRKVAEFYGIPVEQMTDLSRKRQFAWPRQRAMWLVRELTHKSLPDIAHHFGDRDHTTVIHALKAVNRRMAEDPGEETEVLALLASLEHVRRHVA